MRHVYFVSMLALRLNLSAVRAHALTLPGHASFAAAPAESRSQRRSLRRARHITVPRRDRLLVAQKEAAARLRPPGVLKQVDLSSIFDSAILQEQRKIAIKVGSCSLTPEAVKPQTQPQVEEQQPVARGHFGLPPCHSEALDAAGVPATYELKTCQQPAFSVSTPAAADVPKSALQVPSTSTLTPVSTSSGLLPIIAQPPGDLLTLLESGFGNPQNPSKDLSPAVPHPAGSTTAVAADGLGFSGGIVSRHKQLTSAEMNDFPVFKNYAKGDPCAKIYVKNLSKLITEQDLRSLLAEFCVEAKDILDVRVMTEGRMKGQAFITFTDPEVAMRAVEHTNGLVLHDKPIVVMFAKSAKSS